MTDGATRARPAVVVCCVAILVALPTPDAGRRLGRRTFDSSRPWPASERGADERDTTPIFTLISQRLAFSPSSRTRRERDGEERPSKRAAADRRDAPRRLGYLM